MKPYKLLNDASHIVGQGMSYGTTEIYYMLMSKKIDGESLTWLAYNGWRPKRDELVKTQTADTNYVLLGSIAETDLNNIFQLMQGEFWSPEGQARELIESLGADHTSMSVGDVVVVGRKAMFCAPCGWEELK